MHATDDVHARGAKMVARAASDRAVPCHAHSGPVYDQAQADRSAAMRRTLDNLIMSATFAKQVLRAQHKAHGAIVARQVADDLAEAVRRIQALNDSDTALARAFDEA